VKLTESAPKPFIVHVTALIFAISTMLTATSEVIHAVKNPVPKTQQEHWCLPKAPHSNPK
jgi:hypothetical protein